MLLTLLFLLAVPAMSTAAENDPRFTPSGYTFCGWQSPEGGWSYDEPDGAFLRGFARDMTCTAARRNIARVRYSQRPPYRPYRPGYRCRKFPSDFELTDVRCVRRGGAATFRFQTGA